MADQPQWVVATVLRSGGDFRPEHVLSLQEQVRRHFKAPHQFVCLTDLYFRGCERILLKHSWRGWWSKLELFRLPLHGKALLFLDLDTVLAHDFTLPVPSGDELWMIKDFMVFGQERWKSRWWASGAMAWSGDLLYIYQRAVKLGEPQFSAYYRWDQIFIGKAVEDAGRTQMRALNDVVGLASYKVHGLDAKKPDERQPIVCFHGKPRPWDVDTPWVREARNASSGHS